MNLTEDMKKIFLAGVGAIAMTAERSQDMIEKLVSKGELTVEQGKILNEELMHNMSSTMSRTKDNIKKGATKGTISILEQIDSMTSEELKALKEKLSEMETQSDDETAERE